MAIVVHGGEQVSTRPLDVHDRRRRMDDHPRARPSGHQRAVRNDPWGHPLSASTAADDDDTQPKIAPCASIIAIPTRWNSGKYEPTQSSSTAHS